MNLRVANFITVSGAIFVFFTIIFQYLVPLWPAPGVDPARVQFHLALLLYTGVALVLIGVWTIIRKTPSLARKLRMATIAICIAAVAAASAIGGNTKAAPRNEKVTTPPSKYRFSHDWVSDNVSSWNVILGSLKGKPNIHALEIGSFEGRSSIWFLENILTDSTATITCIDIWEGFYEKRSSGSFEGVFDENIKAYGQTSKVIKIKGRSDFVLRELKRESFDFIYIDGSHWAKDVLVDAVLAWDLLKPGGYMIFDDYYQSEYRSWFLPHQTAKMAIDAFLNIFGPYLELLHKDYQVVVKKKTSDDSVNLATHKPLRAFIIGLQQLLR